MEGIGYFNRVAETAKLAGVTGSVQKRNTVAARLNQKLYVMNSESIQKRVAAGGKEYLTLKEFAANFDKLISKIVVIVRKNEDKTSNGGVQPLTEKCENGMIVGFLLNLPLEKPGRGFILRKNRMETTTHELRHILDLICQPKMLARKQKSFTYKQKLEHHDLYKKVMYREEAQNAKTRIPIIKEEIDKHFNNVYSNFSLDERINIMQTWRYNLQLESNAYKDGAFYDVQPLFKNTKNGMSKQAKSMFGLSFYDFDKDFRSDGFSTLQEKQKGLTSYKKEVIKNANKKVNDKFLFEEKIELLEEMILETIAEVRGKMAAKRGSKLFAG